MSLTCHIDDVTPTKKFNDPLTECLNIALCEVNIRHYKISKSSFDFDKVVSQSILIFINGKYFLFVCTDKL